MNNEINYNEIFGLDEPVEKVAEQSETEEEVADIPEDDIIDKSEKIQEVADPVISKEETETEPVKQSEEDNAKFANMRRKLEAEQKEIIAKIKAEAEQAAQATVNDVFANSGMINPYNNKAIKSKADYDEYKAMLEEEELKTAGIDRGTIDKIISNNPDVKAAREARAEMERTKAQAVIDSQIAEIAKLNPDIKSIDDIRQMKTYDKFYELVMKGNSFVDAYKVANIDSIVEAKGRVAKQAAINAQSKGHLESIKQKAGNALVTVPKEILEQYRTFNPEWTEKEIQKHYTKYNNQKG